MSLGMVGPVPAFLCGKICRGGEASGCMSDVEARTKELRSSDVRMFVLAKVDARIETRGVKTSVVSTFIG